MRTELDAAMDSTMAALTAPGGMLGLGSIERFGVTLPTIAVAPPALNAYFAHYAGEHRDQVFLVAGDERLTFAEVEDAAECVACALVSAHGIQRGDRIGIAMRNSPSWIVLYMGIIMAGGVATLLNGWWQSDELEAAIRDVDCNMVFADPPRVKRLAQIAGLATPVIGIDDTLPLRIALDVLLKEDPVGVALPPLGPDDHATILFTSGSTGQSKGALCDHRAIIQAIFNYLGQAMMMLGIATAQGNPPVGQPVTLLTIPLFHITGEVPVFLQSFAMGRKLVLMPKWDAREAMRLIEAEGVTYFVGVPLMSLEMLNHPRRGDYDLSTVSDFAAGGAPRPVEHVRRLDAELPGSPLIGYGLTETNAVGAGNWRSNYLGKPSSTGRASAPLVDFAILDDAGHHVRHGGLGEIGIRSAACFEEYWGRPADTAACYTADGFFRTGDLGYLDNDGYLFIVDRKKDIIIRGGENISCQEVEAALYTHAAVTEAAVFGLADERLGEVPCAVVHLADPRAASEADLLAFLAEHLAAFKVPHRLWFSASPLPRLGTEKIDKLALRKRYGELVTG